MPGLSRRESQNQRQPARERITSPSRIGALMSELQTRGELLSAPADGCEEVSRARILEVRESEQELLVEHLDNEALHLALLQSGEVRLSCHLRGMHLSFAARLVATEPAEVTGGYRMNLPGSISCSQRRNNSRHRLNPGLAVFVSIPDLDGRTVKGDVFDLSATGIGLFLHTRRSPSLGQQLPGVTLHLPHSQPIRCTLEIRFVHKNPVYRTLRAGARFVGLEPSQQILLDRFLAEQHYTPDRHNRR